MCTIEVVDIHINLSIIQYNQCPWCTSDVPKQFSLLFLLGRPTRSVHQSGMTEELFRMLNGLFILFWLTTMVCYRMFGHLQKCDNVTVMLLVTHRWYGVTELMLFAIVFFVVLRPWSKNTFKLFLAFMAEVWQCIQET